MRRNSAVLAVAFSLALSLVLAPAVQAAKIQTNHDPQADFKSFKTYRWNKEEGPEYVGLDRPVRVAAEAVLAKKGLTKVPVGEPADLELMYNAGAINSLTAGVGIAPGWWGDLFLIPAAEWYTTGGIALTFHEVATDKVVWSGWKVAKGTNQDAPQVMVKRAPGYAKDIFSSIRQVGGGGCSAAEKLLVEGVPV